MAMIDAQKLFEKLMERSKRHTDSLNFTYRRVGEDTLAGKEIDDYSKARVAEDKARIQEIDEIVKIMQEMTREAKNG